MKKLRPFAAIIALLFLSTAAIAMPEDRWLHGSAGYARALELQRELNVPLVVYFYADWCPYCHQLDNDYLPTAPVREYLRGVVKVRINPENGPAERKLARQYGVTGYPSFFIMSNLSSFPQNIHPFRKGGANLTPAQFASACQQASAFSTPPSISRAPAAPERVVNAASRKPKAQIVEVPPSGSPTFINNAPLPTLDAILDKYVAAIGGRQAQSKLTSRVSRGRVDVPGVSFGGKVEVYAKAPNKSLTVMNVEPIGLLKQGFDGRTNWTLSAKGLDVASAADQAGLADADFYREIKLKELYARIKLMGKVKEGFREVYLVEAVPRGGTAESFYFDVESGLLVRRDLSRRTSRGLVRAEVYFSDWREIDGVRVPFKMTQVMPTMRFVTTFDEVKHNVPVDDALFRQPQ